MSYFFFFKFLLYFCISIISFHTVIYIFIQSNNLTFYPLFSYLLTFIHLNIYYASQSYNPFCLSFLSLFIHLDMFLLSILVSNKYHVQHCIISCFISLDIPISLLLSTYPDTLFCIHVNPWYQTYIFCIHMYQWMPVLFFHILSNTNVCGDIVMYMYICLCFVSLHIHTFKNGSKIQQHSIDLPGALTPVFKRQCAVMYHWANVAFLFWLWKSI